MCDEIVDLSELRSCSGLRRYWCMQYYIKEKKILLLKPRQNHGLAELLLQLILLSLIWMMATKNGQATIQRPSKI
jgi:hypothetical protein